MKHNYLSVSSLFSHPGRYVVPLFQRPYVWTEDEQWKLLRTEPALPNFGEMLWIGRGHDVKHTMDEFSDTPKHQASGPPK